MYHDIREQDPLKQGLKPGKLTGADDIDNIREQDPLKQGLKPPTSIVSAETTDVFVSKIH